MSCAYVFQLMKPIGRVSLYCWGFKTYQDCPTHPRAVMAGLPEWLLMAPGPELSISSPLSRLPPANWRQTLVEVSFVFAATAAAASEISITLSDEERRGAVSTRSLALPPPPPHTKFHILKLRLHPGCLRGVYPFH